MNKDKQRIAIAVACGIPAEVPHWRYSFTAHGEHYNVETHERFRMQDACEIFGCKAEEFSDTNPDLPDYLNDLNAMHEAEKVLVGRNNWELCDYVHKLHAATHGWPAFATAAQRAEAFLRTLNLWEDAS